MSFINTQSRLFIISLLVLAATSALAQSNSDTQHSIGVPYPGKAPQEGAYPGLTEMGAQLELSYMRTIFQDVDMSGSYGGLSLFGVGFSFATSDRTRFFLSARYGRNSGDPYHDIDGISDEDGITVKALPILIGLKFNASKRQNFRLYLGGAFQYAFMWEDITTGDSNDNPQDIETSGTSTGYYLFVAPELPLGNNALGLEFGWGGSKGNVTSSNHSHGVDLTGAHAKIYFTLGL